MRIEGEDEEYYSGRARGRRHREAGIQDRWNEAHEVGHSIIPWHDNLLLGDNEFSLNPNCHEQMEAEANFAAGQLLFLQE